MAGGRLTIRNDLSELRRMSAWLQEQAVAAGIPAAQAHVVDVCANEAVCNIITYACPGPGDPVIELELTALDHGVRLIIRDQGQPFDPIEGRLPEAPSSLADAPIGGLGIKLIRKLASHCEYRREGNRNILVLEARGARQHA